MSSTVGYCANGRFVFAFYCLLVSIIATKLVEREVSLDLLYRMLAAHHQPEFVFFYPTDLSIAKLRSCPCIVKRTQLLSLSRVRKNEPGSSPSSKERGAKKDLVWNFKLEVY
jgi:hypothetical protein